MQRVNEVVWNWKAGTTGGVKPTGARSLRVKGLIQALVMSAIGLVVFSVLGHRAMACGIWTLAVVVLASSAWFPRLFSAMERFGVRLGRWAGAGLTYLLLVPFFYLVFVPGRVVLWLLGKDPMQRAFPAREATCWAARKARMDDAHYRKQFS